MTCNEGTCTTVVTVQNAFVPPLADISAAAKKAVENLTADELLLVAYCDECSALHVMCGEKLYSVEQSLAEIGRRRAERVRFAAARQEAADRAAARHSLGAALIGLGFHAMPHRRAHA